MESRNYDNVLFVLSPNTIIFNGLRQYGFRVQAPCKGHTLPAKMLRGAWIKGPFPGKSIWYNTKVNDRNADLIIVLAGFLTVGHYLLWLRRHHPESRIIMVYDDPICKSIHPADIPDGCCEVRSWDAEDCKKYGLKQTKGFFMMQNMKVDKKESTQDILFVGKDKGRAERLLELEKKFNEMGLSTCFHITSDYKFMKRFKPFYKDLISYDEVMEKVSCSRAILDYLQEGQTGASMRTMECLFNEIKLITNNRCVKDMDFYRKENIFILGEDRLEDLPAFMASPYRTVAPEIIAGYEVHTWLDAVLAEKPI